MVEAKDKSGSVTDEEESNDRAANSSKMEIHSSPGGGVVIVGIVMEKYEYVFDGDSYGDDYGEIWRCR